MVGGELGESRRPAGEGAREPLLRTLGFYNERDGKPLEDSEHWSNTIPLMFPRVSSSCCSEKGGDGKKPGSQ